MTTLPQAVDGLSALILEMDPARVTWAQVTERIPSSAAELTAELTRVRRDVRARLEAARASAEAARAEKLARLDAALERASATLAELREALPRAPDATRWRHLYGRLAESYDDLRRLVDALPQPVPAPPARRITRMNLSRAAFHAGSGLGAALLYRYVLDRGEALLVLAVLLTGFVAIEAARRRWARVNDWIMGTAIVRRVARPHEYTRVNSSTYFAFGLLFCAICFAAPAVQVGCVVLALADPVASTLGRRFGRAKLYRDKSWVGTGSFVVVGALAAYAFLAVAHPQLRQPGLLAVVAAAAGAVAELVTTRLDDNLTIPVIAAAAGHAVLALG